MGDDNLHRDKPYTEAVRRSGLTRGLLKSKTTKTR